MKTIHAHYKAVLWSQGDRQTRDGDGMYKRNRYMAATSFLHAWADGGNS